MKKNIGLFLFFLSICVTLAQQPSINATSKVGTKNKGNSVVETANIAPTLAKPPVRTEIALRDGSVLNCTLKENQFPFTTAYGQELNISLKTVQHIVFKGKTNQAVIHFRNNDQLHGSLSTEEIKTKSLLGDAKIPQSAIRSIKINAPSSAKDARLTYWSTLDSPEAIYHPKVGPTGTYIEGSFIEGKYGKAFSTDGKPEALTVILPQGAFGKSGCIEFWAKLNNPPQHFGDGSNPRFFGIHGKNFGFLLEFSANNGLGYGGLCTLFGGNTCGSSTFGNRNASNYAAILEKDIAGWHHYAVTWSHSGIASDKPEANGKAIAIFVDGRHDSSIPLSSKTAFLNEIEKENSTLVIASHRYAGFRPFSFAIDELKIWNYDKTDFDLK